MYQPSIQNVQPGDRVIYSEGTTGHRSIRTVERVTKTQIILPKNMRFRRTDGRAVGSSPYTLRSIQVATEDLVAKVTDEQVRRVASQKLADLSKRIKDQVTSLDEFSAELGRLSNALAQTARDTHTNH